MMLDSVPSLLDSSAKSLEGHQAHHVSRRVTSDMGSESESRSPVSMSAPDDLFLTGAFHKADTDGDGKLSHQELKDLIQSLGLGEDEEKLNKFVLEVDADNNGMIDLDEFQVIVDKVSSKSTMTFEQQLRETFDLYDVDGSGGLDQEEIKQLMATLGHDLTDEEVSDMIAEVDEDGNGDIDYDEFVSMFKGIKSSGDGKQKKVEKKSENAIKRGNVFDDAKQHVSFGRIFRLVTWLYSERKMILLACTHFVATMVIWGESLTYCLVQLRSVRMRSLLTSSLLCWPAAHNHSAHFALIKFQQQENAVPEGAPRYWAKRLIPPIEFGSMHAILFQMALIPFTMSRYSIASFSNSKLNKYLPLDKALRIHIHLGYTMVSIVFSATIVFFIFFGLSCAEGEVRAGWQRTCISFLPKPPSHLFIPFHILRRHFVTSSLRRS